MYGSGYEVTGTEDVVLVVGRSVFGRGIASTSVDLLLGTQDMAKANCMSRGNRFNSRQKSILQYHDDIAQFCALSNPNVAVVRCFRVKF